jgi:hypothetical protein
MADAILARSTSTATCGIMRQESLATMQANEVTGQVFTYI